MSETKVSMLLNERLTIVNIGLEGFAEELAENDVPVIHVDWVPPAGGDTKLATLLSKLES